MTSAFASWAVCLVLALAALAIVLAGLWLYAYGTFFAPALSEAIGHVRDVGDMLR